MNFRVKGGNSHRALAHISLVYSVFLFQMFTEYTKRLEKSSGSYINTVRFSRIKKTMRERVYSYRTFHRFKWFFVRGGGCISNDIFYTFESLRITSVVAKYS